MIAGQSVDAEEFAGFESWQDFCMWVKEDPEGSDYAVSVALIKEHSPEGITELLNRVVPADQADVLVSTAHKTKGMEWQSVQMGTDWTEPAEGKFTEEYAMLLYVAITRAKTALGLGSASWINELSQDDLESD